jgi:exosome complex RNA-binding protein Rrp42 (RNase PH superfamily)
MVDLTREEELVCDCRLVILIDEETREVKRILKTGNRLSFEVLKECVARASSFKN